MNLVFINTHKHTQTNTGACNHLFSLFINKLNQQRNYKTELIFALFMCEVQEVKEGKTAGQQEASLKIQLMLVYDCDVGEQ